MTARSLSILGLVASLGVTSCVAPDAPQPAPDAEARPPADLPLLPFESRDRPDVDTLPTARPSPPEEPPDPAAEGISGLARLARYVFREMRAAGAECSFANPLHDTIAFAFHIEVGGGRMRNVHLAWAGTRVGGELHPLETPPPELVTYVQCLAPRLEALPMSPAPVDGTYQPEYSYPGHTHPPGS